MSPEAVDGPSEDEVLDALAVDPPGIDPLAQIEEGAERTLAAGLQNRLDRGVPHALDRLQPESDRAILAR